jgi:hypothetical protein
MRRGDQVERYLLAVLVLVLRRDDIHRVIESILPYKVLEEVVLHLGEGKTAVFSLFRFVKFARMTVCLDGVA